MMGMFKDHGDNFLWDDYYCYDTYVHYGEDTKTRLGAPDVAWYIYKHLHALCEAATINAPTSSPPVPASTSKPKTCVPDWTSQNGSCYLMSSSKMNWIDAQKFCDGKGGYLAEIQSSEEQTNVEHMLDPRNMYWIGLTRPDDSYRSVFEWQHSKTPLAWSNWLPGHPHHYDRHDHHYADIIDNHHHGNEHKSDKGYSPIHYDRHER